MAATPNELRINLPMEQIEAFCRHWGIARLEIFGSALRDDFRPASDLDFLYVPGPRFDRRKVNGPWARNFMVEELEQLLGRRVDLIERTRVEAMGNWIKRQHILQTATPIYVD